MSELKACPFCGGEASIRKWQDEDLWSHNIVEWQKAHCTECECEGISSCPGYEPDTVQAWNERACNWRPIETAPKDATWIMLGMVDRNEILLGFWHSLMNGWWGQGGSAGEWKKWERATHWQPLPEPPNVP